MYTDANKFAITNAKLVLPDKVIPRGSIVIKGKRIAAIQKGGSYPRSVAKINARGNFVASGFIDLHIHGDVEQISRQEAKGGTIGFLATLHPARPKALLSNIVQVLAQSKKVSGAKVLGIRLEGPFLNRAFCGALPAQALRLPNLQEARAIVKQAGPALKIVVLAPELKGAKRLIRVLRKNKVIASIGHTGATYAQTQTAIAVGAQHATHTFNRMREFNHHDPGALGAVLTDKRVSCEVIADGVHVHPACLRLLLACKGTDKMMLITDSTAAQKLPRKRRCGGVFKLTDGTLYGTSLTLNRALNNAVKFLGLSLPQAVRLVTLNPAKVLKIDRIKGSLSVGKDADIVIFDKAFNIKMTMVEGKIVYKRVQKTEYRVQKK